jgi:hypothetical protein
VLRAPPGARGGENVGHHRFSVTISLTADVQEATQNKQIPSDQAVTAKIANQLNGLDVGDGYTVSAATVTTYAKKRKK